MVRHTIPCFRKTIWEFLLRKDESSALYKWHLVSYLISFPVSSIYKCLEFGIYLKKLRSGSAFLQKCCLWFSGISSSLSFPKGLYRKYFSTMRHRSSALWISRSDCGMYCFTSKNETFEIVSWCPHQLHDCLIKTQKAVTTSVFNSVYLCVGVWRQRNVRLYPIW